MWLPESLVYNKVIPALQIADDIKITNNKCIRISYFIKPRRHKKKWAGQSEKRAYGFSDVMWASDVDDIIYDVILQNEHHATEICRQNTVTFIF